MSFAEAFVLFWFFSSVLVHSGGSVWLWQWLERHGVRLRLFYIAVPGYLNRTLYDWCREHGRPLTRRRVLRWRRITMINLIAAAPGR